MQELIKFDFGSEFVLPKEGYVKPLRYYSDSKYMWVTEPLARWELGENPPYIDYSWQYRGEFRLGLAEGHYELRFLFYSWDEDKPEFQVRIDKTEAYAPIHQGETIHTFSVKAEKGKKQEYVTEFDFDGGVLAIAFPEAFFINALEVECEKGGLIPMYPEALKNELPDAENLKPVNHPDLKKVLSKYCDALVESKTDKGFIGDYWTTVSDDRNKIKEGTHEGDSMLWYTAAYVVRTLIMGYRLAGEKKWLEEAVALLDKFVSEQLPDGSFTQVYRAEPTKELTKERLEEVCSSWRNLADVGSMVAALVIGSAFVDEERKRNYLECTEKYFSEWALKFRESSGGFRNGWTGGPSKLIYGVSTASSALSMALFAKMTGKDEYMKYAEEAALFLAENWNEDGRYMHWPYDNEYPGHEYYQDTTFFADAFYVLEAVCGVLALSKDKDVREKLFAGLETYLFGSAGLLKKKEGLSWWPIQCTWHNSKSAGNLIFMADYLTYGKEFGASAERMEIVKKELEICTRFLCDEEAAKRIGVLVKEPKGSYPFATNRVQSWRGCAAAATGFAGLSISQVMMPRSIYLED